MPGNLSDVFFGSTVRFRGSNKVNFFRMLTDILFSALMGLTVADSLEGNHQKVEHFSSLPVPASTPISMVTAACAQCRLNVDERLCNAAPDRSLFAFPPLCDDAVLWGTSSCVCRAFIPACSTWWRNLRCPTGPRLSGLISYAAAWKGILIKAASRASPTDVRRGW